MATRFLKFDANAGGELLPQARQSMIAALDQAANPSSIHAAGRRARGLVEAARESVARLCGAGKDDIIFTSGATEAAALALSPVIMKGRERHPVGRLFVAATEHPCVLAGGRLSDRITIVPVDENGVIDLQALERLLAGCDKSAGSPLLALMLANNETGVLQPVTQAARIVREHDGFVFCDAVQAFGRIEVDVAALGADMVSISSHKIGGPQGAGALVLAGADIRPMPLLTGGGQERGHRAGTENVAAIAGFGVAAEAVMNHLKDVDSVIGLRRRLEAELHRLAPDMRIAGEAASRLPNTIMAVVPSLPAETAVIAFDLEGVAVSSGSACSSGKVTASHVLLAMGYSDEGAGNGIRISLPADVTNADIDRFLSVWRSVDQRLRPDKAA